MSSRIGRIGLVGGVILLGMAGCASGPGESDLLPDEGPDHAASVRAASGR